MNTEPTHTPGPWGAGDSSVYALNSSDSNRFSCVICPGHNDQGKFIQVKEIKANARLIASAPDMLEELKKIYLWLQGAERHCEHLRGEIQLRQLMVARVILKAEGGSSE